VSISVDGRERVISLRLSKIFVRYCPELEEKLLGIIGEGSMRLEEISAKR